MTSSDVARIEKTGLVKYDAMQRAIVEAVAVDEVKDIRDKAMALEKYAQQARNFEAERRAAQIRIKAEMRGGVLLKEMEKAKGARGNPGGRGAKLVRSHSDTAQPKTLTDLGLSKVQSSRWQQLAENPKAVERYLRQEKDVPTTAGALAAVTPPKPAPKPVPLPFTEDALWVVGHLRDLQARKIKPQAIVDGCDKSLHRQLTEHLNAVLPILQKLRTLL